MKAFYNFKQSFCFWYKYFSTFLLTKLSLKHIYIDKNIFLFNTWLKNLIFNVFVDNLIIIALKNNKIIKQIKIEFKTLFFIL